MSRHPFPRRLAAVVLGTTLVVAAAACGSGDDADAADGTVTLRFSYFTSEQNPIAQTWKQWMEEVTERSDGSIEFEQYWDGTLLGADEVVEGLVDGRADIAQVTPTFYPGRFPLTAVNELPFGTNNVGAIASAMSTLVEEDEDLAEEEPGDGARAGASEQPSDPTPDTAAESAYPSGTGERVDR